MKRDDRVKLLLCDSNTGSIFWKKRDIGYRSVGTIEEISSPGIGDRFAAVRWDNGQDSICHIDYLKLSNEENVSLPNLKFKRQKV